MSDDMDVGALEDGHRPPSDPDDWGGVTVVLTHGPCPECGTARGVMLGPRDALRDYVLNAMSDYGTGLGDDWTTGYDHPVYVYCDDPRCDWEQVAEWREVRPELEAWIQGDAPTWRERLVELLAERGQA